jgi:hypothetical protein
VDVLVAVRTGQSHRTLFGHTGPVTCLQFDEMHIVSGSLDKSIRVGRLVCPVDLLLRQVLIDLGPSDWWYL